MSAGLLLGATTGDLLLLMAITMTGSVFKLNARLNQIIKHCFTNYLYKHALALLPIQLAHLYFGYLRIDLHIESQRKINSQRTMSFII